ncbi:uncharacterized protein CLUP02_06954 [Colletotrichum lupini]|uniref:Uncharacterized protein n=1 Tax=Colletotrichum lupini TaxID=145971 RepID=A0A9Q8SQM0_9PEZI|nr:uncharacterized protein CLUP02_06954 [Colletotrichum lupini]UQC81468.1 hypothetical protein CLUP02_06954 [Colletotrichum lupini]
MAFFVNTAINAASIPESEDSPTLFDQTATHPIDDETVYNGLVQVAEGIKGNSKILSWIVIEKMQQSFIFPFGPFGLGCARGYAHFGMAPVTATEGHSGGAQDMKREIKQPQLVSNHWILVLWRIVAEMGNSVSMITCKLVEAMSLAIAEASLTKFSVNSR